MYILLKKQTNKFNFPLLFITFMLIFTFSKTVYNYFVKIKNNLALFFAP